MDTKLRLNRFEWSIYPYTYPSRFQHWHRCNLKIVPALQWRHNGRYGISYHQPHDCLLNRLFRRRSKKISKLRVTGLCEGNSPVTGGFPTQRASLAEHVSIWWRHHGRWSHPEGMEEVDHHSTTTKHNKARTKCISIGAYSVTHKNDVGFVIVCVWCVSCLFVCGLNVCLTQLIRSLYQLRLKTWF